MIELRAGGLDRIEVIELLKKHEQINRDVSPPESCHIFNIARLKADDISFWSAWEAETLLGVGAVKQLSADHGEVKSMHTCAPARRRGVGALILEKLIATAREKGMSRLSLETGSMDYFAPARALYARHGFVECAPFADYVFDPNSLFMTREI